jgi:class 3 adenylate cyclase/TolB-like protein
MEDLLPRKLVAILYADVAGYSRLTGEDEDATHRTLKEYLDLVAGAIESHRGQVMHYAGDAVLAKFDAVVDALSAAVVIQNEINTRNEDVPDERKVEFRIGINSGDVIEDRGDIYGDGVNVAARLEGLAEPGGICISDAVRSAVGKKLDIGYKFIGEQEVKNISEPVRAYKVQMEWEKVVSPLVDPGSPGSQDKPSMAVLPFSDLSGDSSQNHLALGLAEELVATLGCIPWFFVSAPTVSLSSEIAKRPKTQIGKILGVRYLIDGSVQTSKDKVRIVVHLTSAENGQQMWAERFNGNQDDLFDLQDHIARTVIGAIEPKMLQVETLRSQAKHGSLTAFDYYLQALAHIRTMDQADLKLALDLLRSAIDTNPQYGAAHGLTAWLMTLHVPQGLGFDAETGLIHAQKAIEFGQGDADALSEPFREFRRLCCVSQAAMADPSCWR